MSEAPTGLHKSIEAAKLLRLELTVLLTGGDGDLSADDRQAIAGTIEGETTLDAGIRNAVLQIEEDEIFINGCKARETELKNRRMRLEKRVEATRGLIEQAMTVADWSTHQMDIGVVTLGKAAGRVEIDNEADIPTGFWKRSDPTLDKVAIGASLRERQKLIDAVAKLKSSEEREAALAALNAQNPPIPGCHFETGGVSLTIRRS